jgi:hypothetical protein
MLYAQHDAFYAYVVLLIHTTSILYTIAMCVSTMRLPIGRHATTTTV